MRFSRTPLLLFWILILCPSLILGIEKTIYSSIEPGLPAPWLTGPLIAPSSQVIPAGHINIEPYISTTAIIGDYGSDWKKINEPTFWLNSALCQVQIGVTSWMDIQLIPSASWNYTQHTADWALEDLPVCLDIQLYRANPDSWVPNIKLALQEIVPIGKYQKLNPKNKLTDALGGGSWNTQIGVVFGKLVHLYKLHYLNWRFFLQYSLPAPTHLKGFNVYGGGKGTNARFFPPQSFVADLAFEITLAQSWAFALDMIGAWSGKTHFSGSPGVISGSPAPLGNDFSIQYSLAPAIEYNWNANLGVIGGVWFTVAGKNAIAFYSGLFALNYYY